MNAALGAFPNFPPKFASENDIFWLITCRKEEFDEQTLSFEILWMKENEIATSHRQQYIGLIA